MVASEASNDRNDRVNTTCAKNAFRTFRVICCVHFCAKKVVDTFKMAMEMFLPKKLRSGILRKLGVVFCPTSNWTFP